MVQEVHTVSVDRRVVEQRKKRAAEEAAEITAEREAAAKANVGKVVLNGSFRSPTKGRGELSASPPPVDDAYVISPERLEAGLAGKATEEPLEPPEMSADRMAAAARGAAVREAATLAAEGLLPPWPQQEPVAPGEVAPDTRRFLVAHKLADTCDRFARVGVVTFQVPLSAAPPPTHTHTPKWAAPHSSQLFD